MLSPAVKDKATVSASVTVIVGPGLVEFHPIDLPSKNMFRVVAWVVGKAGKSVEVAGTRLA